MRRTTILFYLGQNGGALVKATGMDAGLPPAGGMAPHLPATPPAIIRSVGPGPSHGAPGAHGAGGPAPGPDTQTLHSHGGVYHPERKQLHDKIVGHFLGGGAHADIHALHQEFDEGGGPKHAVFTMGGGGSGKSTYARKKFLKHRMYMSIDPDAIKEHLPEYDPKNPSHVHEESSDIAKRLHGEAHTAGRSYVYDGTGANADSLIKKMQAAKQAGYRVHLHYGAVPMETALERNKMRERQVPEDVLRQQHAAVKESFKMVRALGIADRIKVVDLSNSESVSPYAERRRQILRDRRGDVEKAAMPLSPALQKAILQHFGHHPRHIVGGHSAMANNSRAGNGAKPVRVTLKGDYVLVGKLKDGHVLVDDIVDGGHSARAILGEKPRMKPIPVARLEQMGAHFHYEAH